MVQLVESPYFDFTTRMCYWVDLCIAEWFLGFRDASLDLALHLQGRSDSQDTRIKIVQPIDSESFVLLTYKVSISLSLGCIVPIYKDRFCPCLPRDRVSP